MTQMHNNFTGKAPRKGSRTPLNKNKYSEQRDEETGYGYFGARYMDHKLMTMWLSVDPMADKYPSVSPYAYCAWNPVRLVDPDGREIDPSCKKEWDSQKTYITLKKNSLSSLRDLLSSYSSFFQQNIDELDERIASLDRTLITMSDLEEDPKTIYTLSLTNKNGYVSLITKGDKKGMVSINYSSTSSFVHEVTHAGQYYCNDIGFFLTNGAIAAYDIYDEVHAYKAALAYSLYAYEYDKMSMDQVTPAWIRSRTDSYNDCGNTPINIFSSAETIKNSGIDNLGIYQTYMEIPPQLLMYRH